MNDATLTDTSSAAPDAKLPEPRGATIQHQENSQSSMQSTVTHVLTDAESNLLIHAHGESVDWQAAVEALDDYELMKDPLAIPPECAIEQEQKRFRYRWLDPTNREKFDMQTSGKLRWWVCNRTNAPEIPEQCRDANGLVRRSGLVLAKMPWPMYMARQTMVWKLASHAEKKGPASSEGLEYTGKEGGKFHSGDIVHAEETVKQSIDPRTGEMKEVVQMEFSKQGRHYTPDRDVVSVD